jgi:cyanate permease
MTPGGRLYLGHRQSGLVEQPLGALDASRLRHRDRACAYVPLEQAVEMAIFAFAPAIFGWLRDATDSYAAAFLVAGAAQIAAAAIVSSGRRSSLATV